MNKDLASCILKMYQQKKNQSNVQYYSLAATHSTIHILAVPRSLNQLPILSRVHVQHSKLTS